MEKVIKVSFKGKDIEFVEVKMYSCAYTNVYAYKNFYMENEDGLFSVRYGIDLKGSNRCTPQEAFDDFIEKLDSINKDLGFDF